MKNGHEMLHHPGRSLRFPTKEGTRARAATIPHRAHLATVQRPAARAPHRPSARMPPLAYPERVVFDKLVQVLVFGCAYQRIADASCSESTLRRRRDEWIELGVMERLREICLEAYDHLIGLETSEVAVDCCVTKAPCGGEKAGRSPVDRGKRGIKRSMAVDASGSPLGAVSAPAKAATTRRSWSPPWRRRPRRWGRCPRGRVSTSTAGLPLASHPRASGAAGAEV